MMLFSFVVPAHFAVVPAKAGTQHAAAYRQEPQPLGLLGPGSRSPGSSPGSLDRDDG